MKSLAIGERLVSGFTDNNQIYVVTNYGRLMVKDDNRWRELVAPVPLSF